MVIFKSKVEVGCDLILGDWGAGKTYYFNNKYAKQYNSSSIEKISCFSYTREDFIKQLVRINFWNRWLSLNGILASYISFNWHKMLPKNKVIFIDDLERLPCDENQTNDFIGIINELKKYNRVVIACSLSDIKQKTISQYLEKIVDSNPYEITLKYQIKARAIIETIKSTISKNNHLSVNEAVNSIIVLLEEDYNQSDSSEKYTNHISFVNLFSANVQDAINLRSIEKVFSNIYKQDNATDIIRSIKSAIKLPKKEISIPDIKEYYRYLKVGESIKQYLLAYELLFSYPNLASLLKDFDPNSLDEKQLEIEVEKYLLSKNFNIKHLSKVRHLIRQIGFIKLKYLSFSNVDEILSKIGKESEITYHELISMILMKEPKYRDITIDVEKYFINDEYDKTYGKYKDIVFHNFKQLLHGDEIYIPSDHLDYYDFYEKIMMLINCIKSSHEYWDCVYPLVKDSLGYKERSNTYNNRAFILKLKYNQIQTSQLSCKTLEESSFLYDLVSKNEQKHSYLLLDLLIDIDNESLTNDISELLTSHSKNQYEIINGLPRSYNEENYNKLKDSLFSKYRLLYNSDKFKILIDLLKKYKRNKKE
ncbi:hypothetical protein [Francisella tularensis]|uniref:hypothetical protein n=1 Tax=Francisella tularensis TaxID=263 RepID=UPI001C0F2D74|nr:hypothetical protein [Francisella tularensis]MBK2110553.1 hypothetical protein [Francisella tularensis subsp. novicida FSC595]